MVMSSGSNCVSKSISASASRDQRRKHPARPCRFGPSTAMTRAVRIAVVTSTRGYLPLMACRQFAHRPLTRKYPTMGMLCQGFIRTSQCGQVEFGTTRLKGVSWVGSRLARSATSGPLSVASARISRDCCCQSRVNMIGRR